MRKCYLDKLPKKYGFGANANKLIVDWVNSVGCSVRFKYDDIEGEFEIVDYNSKTQITTISYINNLFSMPYGQISKCQIGNVIGKFNTGHIYKIGDIIEYNLNKFEVVDRFREGKYNDKKYIVRCSVCNSEIKRKEGDIKKYGLTCAICSNSDSYPNRLILSLLKYCKIDYCKEKTFNWSGKKRYDFYIPSLNTIIEVHGNQHYAEAFGSIGGRTLDEEISNDKYKRDLALKNGVEHYIELDCRKSNIEWIKKSVLDSELSKLLDLTTVDWNYINKKSTSNIMMDIVKLSDSNTISDIGRQLGVTRRTVSKYLKIAVSIGLCEYEFKKGTFVSNVSKRVICLNNQMIFDSISQCSKMSKEIFGVKISSTSISSVCNKKTDNAKGYRFEFLDEKECDKYCQAV